MKGNDTSRGFDAGNAWNTSRVISTIDKGIKFLRLGIMILMKATRQVPLRFDDAFFQDYAGNLILDPKVAMVELVANCWDAGAKRVDITWPNSIGGYFEILDNGIGMIKNEFETYWSTFNYNRRISQGSMTEIPDMPLKRRVYGKNGKGRHSLFCFSDSYNVETCKDGNKIQYLVNKLSNNQNPYEIISVGESPHLGHGTKISCNIKNNYIPIEEIENLIGSKFIADPLFEIYLNKIRVNLIDFLKDAQKITYEIPNEGTIIINVIESPRGRLSTLGGVAWWVNKRLVGEHSWRDFDDTYLDGRSTPSRKYTIIIEADILENEVLQDWTWFKDTKRSKEIRHSINEFILKTIQDLMKDIRSESKIQILKKYKPQLKEMSTFSRNLVGNFINEVQMRCPSINQIHLDHTVEIFTKMEQNRTGYDLLQQIAQLDETEIDTLADLLKRWSVNEAKIVLSELEWRLELIEKMDKMIKDPRADELHDLHPLFERGLWIFGPEYESKEFTSNKTLKTIIKGKYKSKVMGNENKRPDIVVFDDKSSINIFSNEKYDNNAEVCGYDKILILELKRSKSAIDDDDARQAEDYALIIKRSGNVNDFTNIICYVLGKIVKTDERTTGTSIKLIPRSYDIVLRQAHARTFNLIKKIKEIKDIKDEQDTEVKAVLAEKEISDY